MSDQRQVSAEVYVAALTGQYEAEIAALRSQLVAARVELAQAREADETEGVS